MPVSEKLKELIRVAARCKKDLESKEETLQRADREASLVRSAFNDAQASRRYAFKLLLEEARQSYKSDRLIEVDGVIYLLKLVDASDRGEVLVALELEKES